MSRATASPHRASSRVASSLPGVSAVFLHAVAALSIASRFASNLRPPLGVYQPEISCDRGQPEVRVVLAQPQAVLRPAAEHAVGLIRAERDKIVHQYAEVSLVPLRRPRVAARDLSRRVQSRQQSLGRSLFVAGRAVDLAREIQARDCFRFKRGLESARVEEVIFDGIARPGDPRVFEALDAAGPSRTAPRTAGSWKCRWDRARWYRGLPAPRRFDARSARAKRTTLSSMDGQ